VLERRLPASGHAAHCDAASLDACAAISMPTASKCVADQHVPVICPRRWMHAASLAGGDIETVPVGAHILLTASSNGIIAGVALYRVPG